MNLRRKVGKVRINDKINIFEPMISVIFAGFFQFFSLRIRDVSRFLETVKFHTQFVKILVQWKCKTDKYYTFDAVSLSYVNGFHFGIILKTYCAF